MTRSLSKHGNGLAEKVPNGSPIAVKSASLSQQSRGIGNRRQRSHPGSLQPAIRVVMMPRDANHLGTIFGGVILSSLDLAGAVEAHQHSDRNLVTAAMREVRFIAPVFVGDLVSFYTETVSIGDTSITVRITVDATRAKSPHKHVRVTQAEVVYVAIDEGGKPVPIRPDSSANVIC